MQKRFIFRPIMGDVAMNSLIMVDAVDEKEARRVAIQRHWGGRCPQGAALRLESEEVDNARLA